MYFLDQAGLNSCDTVRRLLEYCGKLLVGEFARVDVVEKLAKICRGRSKTVNDRLKCITPCFPVWREESPVWHLGLLCHPLIISPFHSYMLVLALEIDRNVLSGNISNNTLLAL